MASSIAPMKKRRLIQIKFLAKVPKLSSREGTSKPKQTKTKAKLQITNASSLDSNN